MYGSNAQGSLSSAGLVRGVPKGAASQWERQAPAWHKKKTAGSLRRL